MTSTKNRKIARELMTIAEGMPPGKERGEKIREAEKLSERVADGWLNCELTVPD